VGSVRRGRHGLSGRTATGPPVGTTFSFALNVPATVTLSFARSITGRRVHGRCLAPTRRNRHHHRCHASHNAGTVSVAGVAGANEIHFDGSIAGRRRLPKGHYVLTLIASTVTGQSSSPQRIAFTIA
jgi:hypothetical protein